MSATRQPVVHPTNEEKLHPRHLLSEKSPGSHPPTAAPANPGPSVATQIHQREELQEEKRDLWVMNSKWDINFKGGTAVMSFGPAAAPRVPSLPSRMSDGCSIFFCLSVHKAACTWHRGQRPLVLPSKGLQRFCHGNFGTPGSQDTTDQAWMPLGSPSCTHATVTLSEGNNPAQGVPAHGRRAGSRRS